MLQMHAFLIHIALACGSVSQAVVAVEQVTVARGGCCTTTRIGPIQMTIHTVGIKDAKTEARIQVWDRSSATVGDQFIPSENMGISMVRDFRLIHISALRA